jgi:hypothetical protein
LGFVQCIDSTPFFRVSSFCRFAQISLAHRARKQSARGILKDELFITGDIISPIAVAREALK